MAKAQQKSGTGFAQIAGFAAVWTALLLIVVSVLGTVIMRRVSHISQKS